MTPLLKDSHESHTVDPTWFMSRIGKGTAEVSITQRCRESSHPRLLRQVLTYGITWDPNTTHWLHGKWISVKALKLLHHNYLLACPSSLSENVNTLTERTETYSSVSSVLHLVSCTKFLNYVWWANKRMNTWVWVIKLFYQRKQKVGVDFTFFFFNFIPHKLN